MKDRDYSLKLEGLITAQDRLPAGHLILPVLSAKQTAVEAGIGGEERVAEVFRKSPFCFENRIYHDLSLSCDEKFQIDSHCLTPWHGFVFEVKNIGGVLEFKDNPPQLISTKDNGHQFGYESPVVQLQRNCDYLTEWLWSRNIQLPIYRAVVLAYPRQIVKVPPAHTTLLFPSLVPTFIKNIRRPEQKLDPDTFAWLSAELLRSHQRFIPRPVSEAYQIPLSDFRPGVRCKVCQRLGMIKLPRTWVCPTCDATDPIAHQKNLLEWFLIYKRTITNRECREFLGVDIHTAKRILQGMGFKGEGDYRYRKYLMEINNFDFLIKNDLR
ncbi:nuclease-related domain-containing protein [Neobacillus kokaensis]|uniref:NERD domain-containing protein n=1 Tax=Neobacillus kokaensis TaxID=2759023 RepID=A0ABQ3N1Q9_9BACI|nr:nuclease-related domain-containing protein [Neobacillus kokaensis]GHH98031.1 hypothetical protein AM1BK_15740 [Neobacillus kokaensis]